MTHPHVTPSLPPMEWYPDPADATRERYWDGQQWTHNTRPAKPKPPVASPSAGPSPRAVGGNGPFAPVGATPVPGARAIAEPMTADGVPLAGWLPRVGAFLVDNFVVSFVLSFVAGGWADAVAEGYTRWLQDFSAGGRMPDISTYGFTDALVKLALLQALVLLAYHWVMVGRWGQTLGKMVAGIRVVPLDQGRASGPGWARAGLRGLVFVACLMFSLPMLLSGLLPLANSRRQSLEDIAARTQVVRSR